MKIVESHSELLEQIQALKSTNPTARVGFVPTMGALHKGHLSLVSNAANHCEIIVVSVFVNPTQFNNQQDLKKYPRTIKEDIELLKTTSCSILFHPSEEEVYPPGFTSVEVDLKGLDLIMEGAFRPGHFKGVITVVNRLFELVKPDVAFFGKKDFQQLAIIKQMVNFLDLNIEIVEVEIMRADSGLALSSRNARLSEIQKKEALIIYSTLKTGSKLFKSMSNSSLLKEQLIGEFNKGNLKLEYLEIVHPTSLKVIDSGDKKAVCCIAAQCGEVRLIDNMEYTKE